MRDVTNPPDMMLAIVHAFVHLPPPFSMPECAVVSPPARSIIFQAAASWTGVVGGAAPIAIPFVQTFLSYY